MVIRLTIVLTQCNRWLFM